MSSDQSNSDLTAPERRRAWRTPVVILPSRLLASTDKTGVNSFESHCSVPVNTFQAGLAS
jgi:hypothetical protein